MQVNRFSLGFQEALKSATNFNTARSETLFDDEKYGVSKEDGEELDFSTWNIEDLNVTEDQIANLFDMFKDEVIAVFGSNLPFIRQQQEQNQNDTVSDNSTPTEDSTSSSQGGSSTKVFTA